ncbi:hypothetical protein D3C79_431190 [compost metagenome]
MHALHSAHQTAHLGIPFAGNSVRQVTAGDIFQLVDRFIEGAQDYHPQSKPGQYRQQHAEQTGDHDQGDFGAGIIFRLIHPLLPHLHGKAAEIAEVFFEGDTQGRNTGFLNLVIVIDLAGLDGVSHRPDPLFQIGPVAVLQTARQFTPAFRDGADADEALHFVLRLLEVIIDTAYRSVGDLNLADFPLTHRQRSGGSGAQRQVGTAGQRSQFLPQDLVQCM